MHWLIAIIINLASLAVPATETNQNGAGAGRKINYLAKNRCRWDQMGGA